MAKARACYNCLHYEQVPMHQIHDETVTLRGFAPRCTKGLNPAIGHAPDNMQLRREGKFEPDEMASFCDVFLWAPRQYPKLRSFATRQLAKMANFTTAALPEKFVPYYEQGSHVRIKIERGINYIHNEYGRVGVSTGWQPAFLLVKNDRHKGSSVVLEEEDRVVALRRGSDKRYKPL